jgi:hypothetical protein
MKSTNPVFVLDTQKNSSLINDLFDLGVIPISRTNIPAALKVIRHEDLRAVLINNEAIEEDVLEFVLNVRDFNTTVPIIIAGMPDDVSEERALRKQKKVSFIRQYEYDKRVLKQKLFKEILDE